MAVTIIDAPCGAGKTEYAIAYMNAHPENSFIFITPYLKEIERIKQGTKVAFYDPKNYQRPDLLGGDFRIKSKLDDFNHLLAQGKDIATTHATFTAATQETINILEDNSYHLIIDEAVDVLTPLNDIVDSPKNRVNKKDVSLMLNNGIITVEDNCRVRWTGGCLSVDDEEAHSYCEVQRYAENGTLLLIDGSFFLWEFPIELFEAVESVTILTYRIEGSFLYPYLQLHDIECIKMSVSGSYGNGFNLIPYNINPFHLQRWKQLITLYDDGKDNGYGSLSATWYKNQVKDHPKSPEATALKNGLRRFFADVGADPSDVMWSCPKESRKDIAPRGYKYTRELTDGEKKGRTNAQIEEYIDGNGLRCWVASNARATNSYSDRHVLAYMLNLNPNPEILKYFTKQGVNFSKDEFALAGLIQWVWRSAIRKGEPITLYLPSPRMKRLFTEWLEGKR